MKNIFTITVFLIFFAFSGEAQLANGSIAPDWTMTDLDGVEHHLYDYLDDGYTVIIDFSATWCPPCWSYHKSGALEELYINHGPKGYPNVSENTTNDVMVFFIEGDESTSEAALYGTGSGTQGNWVEGTPYPIINDASMTAPYQINAWPTVYTVCSDTKIYTTGRLSTDGHYERANVCAMDALTHEVKNTSASSILGIDSDGEFTFNIVNNGTTDIEFKLTLSSNEPEDWSSSIEADGKTDVNTIDISVEAGTSIGATLDVVRGSSSALADYTIEIESLTTPSNIHLFMEYSVIAGITDIVLDNGGAATQWNEKFASGLDFAGNTSHGTVDIDKFIEGMKAKQLNEIKHIYYNVAWTFPSFTNDGAIALATFLDNGGNLFVSGQDIGWDTWDSASEANGTYITRNLYTLYLSADYKGDGSASNNRLTWESDDDVFGKAEGTRIKDIYSGNIYPDEFEPIDPAVAILHYNSPNKIGGIRVEEDGHKVVYIGIDLAMMADEDVQNETIKLTHDWFHEIVSGTEFDEAFKQVVGQNYPNPTSNSTIIPFENLEEDVTLNLVNVAGQTVLTEKITRGTVNYRLDISQLNTGLYHCVLVNKNGGRIVLPIEVIK